MANIYRNIFIHGLTEILGERAANCKTRSGKIIRTTNIRFEDRCAEMKSSGKHPAMFRDAATYTYFARRQDAYVSKAGDIQMTAYSIALSDWFGVPKVLLVNLDAWTGKSRQTIRVKAKDNVWVASVSVTIRDADGNVLETGEAAPSRTGSTWWKYTTKTRIPMNTCPRVEVTARDLAGNCDSFIVS